MSLRDLIRRIGIQLGFFRAPVWATYRTPSRRAGRFGSRPGGYPW